MAMTMLSSKGEFPHSFMHAAHANFDLASIGSE